MNYKKTLVSAAAAAVLATGFTACGDGDTTTNGNTLNKTQGTGTVTGYVQDTNGNPLSGVSVYIADMETTTNDGGLYTFKDVPVSTTAGTDAANASQLISVTIAAPTGYLGASVTVTPSAQIDDAEDNTAAGTVTSGAETFIDGYLAQAGTAVLPQLNASVTATLTNEASGETIANAEVNINLTTSSDNITYAMNSYTATTDTNGAFTLASLPVDSTFTMSVPNYQNLNTSCAEFKTNFEATSNLGSCTVSSITAADTVAPMVSSVTGTIGGTSSPAMLEDDVRTNINVNFSENVLYSGTDYTQSVIIKAGATTSTMTDRSATITASGNTLTVLLDTPLVDAELLDINLLLNDFKDAAGNVLALNPAVGVAYDSIVDSQALKLQLQAFNDLNTNASAVTSLSQTSYSADSTTFTFSPSGAAAYQIKVKNSQGDLQSFSLSDTFTNITIISGNSTDTVTLSVIDNNTAVELTLLNRIVGETITITPFDDLGYAGTARSLVISDN